MVAMQIAIKPLSIILSVSTLLHTSLKNCTVPSV